MELEQKLSTNKGASNHQRLVIWNPSQNVKLFGIVEIIMQ